MQKRRLLEQLDLAKQFDLPVIIHDRDAHGDILEIFQKEVTGVRAVFPLLFRLTGNGEGTA